MKRILNPSANPAGYLAATTAIYAIVQAIANAQAHHTAISAPVIVAALTAFCSALTRQLVTPVSDPRDGNGKPLVVPSAAGTVQPPATTTGSAS